MSDKENAVQQAKLWAQEARTQRETVLSILRYFGLPERDYEALTLIQAKDSENRAAMLTAMDALEQVITSETFYRDARGDHAGPAIDALRAALSAGVPEAPAPDVQALRTVLKVARILAQRPRPMCRDCADEDGTCPNSGLPCDLSAAFQAAERALSAIGVGGTDGR